MHTKRRQLDAENFVSNLHTFVNKTSSASYAVHTHTIHHMARRTVMNQITTTTPTPPLISFLLIKNGLAYVCRTGRFFLLSFLLHSFLLLLSFLLHLFLLFLSLLAPCTMGLCCFSLFSFLHPLTFFLYASAVAIGKCICKFSNEESSIDFIFSE